MLAIQPHRELLKEVLVKFVTDETWKSDGTTDSKRGFSAWENLRALPFEDLESVAKFLTHHPE